METGNSREKLGQALRRLVASSAAGSQLPPVRELVAQHRVSPVTVHRVLQQLSVEGLVVARPGAGTFVAARPVRGGSGHFEWQALALGSQDVPANALAALAVTTSSGATLLSSGYLDPALQPLSLLAGAAARAARRPGTWSRLPAEGLEGLRAWFAHESGGGFRESDVTIVSGGQAALTLAFRALSRPNDPVVFEAPTYLGALATAKAARLAPVPVPCDGEGILPDALARILTKTGARLVYCQPTFANPTGISFSVERRARVLDVVARANAFLIEDDSFRTLALDGLPPRPLAVDDVDGHVVYIRSLTKSTAPGLRVAALVARGAALTRLRSMRELDDFFVSGVLQETALELVTSASWSRHLASVRRTLRERRDALAGAVGELPLAAPVCLPKGGLHLWLRLREGLDDLALAARARSEGIIVSPGSPWFPAEAPGPYLRLSYAAADASVLVRGAAKLKAVIAKMTIHGSRRA
ncbi:Transcriptional regulator, GntR family domain / Aspartate aminotransferase [Labilithrix luteola]|uniref:Transcriptional regulator, GntR family domain / Aspartate aminotransferase n=1 Tax=Labilithrix luteola TaxID=1391654 RepID=A0A0K1QFI2_9BACT|nr:PLP-dependent aminotransferase family protein [Labilithrix luteola]AKV04483.1 Transcriptional regulator, GntR family domain / Aspartate aminotransferase [Labilithrix luteola]